MTAMPDLIGKRVKHWGNLAVGSEHIIDWEVLPAGASLKYQSYDYVIQSLTNVGAHQAMIYDLSAWWLPCYGSDAAETVNTVAGLKALYDMYVPKVDATRVEDSWTVTEDDASIGDDDDQLYFRPDRVSLMTLTQPARPAKLYGKRGWLGWAEGSAFRTGDSTHVRYMKRAKGFVRRGVNTSYPGYVVWVLTLPPNYGTADGEDPDDQGLDAADTFDIAQTFPANQEFADLDFLAPVWDPILASRSVANSGLDQWRRWAVSFLEDTDAAKAGLDTTTASLQQAQVPIMFRMRRQVCMSRRVKGLDTVSPDS